MAGLLCRAADGAAEDYFGYSVAISGDAAIIGAHFDDDLGSRSGSAYIFGHEPLDPATWVQIAKLTASDGIEFDQFGTAVGISGDTAVVSATLDRAESGAAYVFARDPVDPAAWNEIAKLAASDGGPYERFGNAVAIAGDTMLIGSFLDYELGTQAGAAYVYSAQGCEVALGLEPSRLRAGDELRVAVDLVHRRSITVTVPFLLWVEDAAGRVVVEKSSPPITMEPGDRLEPRLAVTLPQGMPAGTYRVLVGVRRMQQGIAWASQRFRLVE